MEEIAQEPLVPPHIPQTIDLSSGAVGRASPPDNPGAEAEEAASSTPHEAHATAVAAAREQLRGKGTGELLAFFRLVQEQRAVIYRDFDQGLGEMEDHGNFDEYPQLCARVTHTFAQLSAQCAAVVEVLESATVSEGREPAALVSRVQALEGEKLTVTAALHLDSIRRCQLERALSQVVAEEQSRAASTLALLDCNLSSLRGKHAGLVEQINELLQEIRYCEFDGS